LDNYRHEQNDEADWFRLSAVLCSVFSRQGIMATKNARDTKKALVQFAAVFFALFVPSRFIFFPDFPTGTVRK